MPRVPIKKVWIRCIGRPIHQGATWCYMLPQHVVLKRTHTIFGYLCANFTKVEVPKKVSSACAPFSRIQHRSHNNARARGIGILLTPTATMFEGGMRSPPVLNTRLGAFRFSQPPKSVGVHMVMSDSENGL